MPLGLMIIVALAAPALVLLALSPLWTPTVLVRFVLTGGRSEARDRMLLFGGWGLASAGVFVGLLALRSP